MHATLGRLFTSHLYFWIVYFVYKGQDIQGGGTWLAISPVRKKLGVLLNVPGHMVENAKSE